MVRVATRRCDRSHVDFLTASAQQLQTVAAERSYDAVFSVAVLHWIPAGDHPGVLAQIHRVLRPGGVFRAEFGGAGQISAVRAVLDEEARAVGGGPAPWYFPDADTYRTLLATAGLSTSDGWVRLLRQRRSVPDADALLGWLRSQVLLGYDAVVPTDELETFRRRAESRAVAELRRVDGSFDQDYVRLDLRAHRADESSGSPTGRADSPAP
jgi:trans-aconitate 2-methyltransferase